MPRSPRRPQSVTSAAYGGTRAANIGPGGLTEPGCVASPRCARDVVPDSPVRLCAKHMREVYVYVHDVVMAELERQASRVD